MEKHNLPAELLPPGRQAASPGAEPNRVLNVQREHKRPPRYTVHISEETWILFSALTAHRRSLFGKCLHLAICVETPIGTSDAKGKGLTGGDLGLFESNSTFIPLFFFFISVFLLRFSRSPYCTFFFFFLASSFCPLLKTPAPKSIRLKPFRYCRCQLVIFHSTSGTVKDTNQNRGTDTYR